jgi:hypothetical protein
MNIERLEDAATWRQSIPPPRLVHQLENIQRRMESDSIIMDREHESTA